MAKGIHLPRVKKILCIRSDRLGEFLLSLPAIRLLKQNYPQAQLLLACQEQNARLIEGVSFVDRVIPFQSSATMKDILTLRRILRRESVDMTVALNPKKEFNIAAFLAGVPIRVGYNRKWGFLLNKKREDDKYLNLSHEIECNAQLVSLVCSSAAVPEIELPWDDTSSLEKLMSKEGISARRPIVVVHPFSSDASKELPADFWKELVQKMVQQNGQVVFIGTKDEFQRSEYQDILGAQCVTFCGVTTLRQTATLIKHFCSLYVGIDSGPFHMASLAKKNFAVIFRKEETIKRWGPYHSNSSVPGRVYTYTDGSGKSIQDGILRQWSTVCEGATD